MAMKRTKTEGEVLEELQSSGPDATVPWIYRWTKISHYYGDYVRELLMACAALMLITAPFYANSLPIELPFIVLGAVVMVCVAAFTSPLKWGVISADAVTAGVGLIIYEIWALLKYDIDPPHQFVLRQTIAVFFLFALYFSTKTLRSMIFRTVGRPDTAALSDEDRIEMVPVEPPLDWKKQAHEALENLNEHEKRDFTD